jgi:hypothetical protein
MQMATAMMKTIMKPAFSMEEIAVELMSIQTIAMNAYALNEEKERVHCQLKYFWGVIFWL